MLKSILTTSLTTSIYFKKTSEDIHMKCLKKIDSYLRSVPTYKFIILMVLLSYIVVLPLIPIAILFELDEIGGPDSVRESSYILEFILVVIIAPFLETLIFQTSVFYILNKFSFFKNRVVIIILISAMAFGMAHSYSTIYILLGFVMGLVLAYAYHIYMQKKASSYKVVTLIHSIRNLLAFLLAFVEIA